MLLAEDQHPIRNLRPGGEHEPFRVSVRARAAGRDLYGLDTGVGQDCVKRPRLVLALGFDVPAAVGISLLVIAINSATALAVRLGGHTSLDWPLLGVFTVAALAGALAGNRVASRVDASRRTAAFGVLLIAVAA